MGMAKILIKYGNIQPTSTTHGQDSRKQTAVKNADNNFSQAERNILTDKTSNIETFTLYVHSVFNNLGTILPFYDDRFTSLRFLNYIGRQRADAEIINMFVTGGKKYLKREFKQRGNDPKRGNPKIRKKRKKGRTEGTTTVKDKGKEKEKTRKKRL
ncbi:hypothetical protein BD770DRAFT_386936, partial [Pilaira anomala]